MHVVSPTFVSVTPGGIVRLLNSYASHASELPGCGVVHAAAEVRGIDCSVRVRDSPRKSSRRASAGT
jgi:hypothetical protein